MHGRTLVNIKARSSIVTKSICATTLKTRRLISAVCIRITIVYTQVRHSLTSSRCTVAMETAIASARKPGHPVGALSLRVAVVTLLHSSIIGAGFALAPRVVIFACAIEVWNCISACRIAVAYSKCRSTLINISAGSQPVISVPSVALTVQAPLRFWQAALPWQGEVRLQAAKNIRCHEISITTALYSHLFKNLITV